MAVTPDDIAKLGKRLGAMWVRLEPFDGSQNVSDFFKDLQRYLSQTGNTTDQEKLYTLISHISGEAKALYRTLETPTFDTLKSALEERFGLTDQEKRQLKSTFYSSKQIPGETFKHYVTRMQQLAREINVPDAEVVEVCIGGARAELRPHLAMASPASVAALLKLAVVANESLVADANPQFEALNMFLTNCSSLSAEWPRSIPRPTQTLTPAASATAGHFSAASVITDRASSKHGRRLNKDASSRPAVTLIPTTGTTMAAGRPARRHRAKLVVGAEAMYVNEILVVPGV